MHTMIDGDSPQELGFKRGGHSLAPLPPLLTALQPNSKPESNRFFAQFCLGKTEDANITKTVIKE